MNRERGPQAGEVPVPDPGEGLFYRRILVYSAPVVSRHLTTRYRATTCLFLGGWLQLLVAGRATALGPHEVVLLVNRDRPDSGRVAKAYAHMRSIPELNVIELTIPATFTGDRPQMSPAAFTKHIWEPVQAALREREIEQHVLAWIYSVGFPIRITTAPAISIHGLTFTRNKLPSTQKTQRGRYASPYFAGPINPTGPADISQSLDVLAALEGPGFPIPSMMLGYTGERGNTEAEVLAYLRKGGESDYSSPTGTIFFTTSRDIRSRIREWQYPRVVKELGALGIGAVVSDVQAHDCPSVLGIMVGAAGINARRNNTFLPGAMAEHCTSYAAAFDKKPQSKLSEWLSVGASGSAGTVTEPSAMWTKFTHARFFVHYAAGCTMLESFYQSIRCPLQILIVGDPLASPFAPDEALAIEGLEGDAVSGRATVRARVVKGIAEFYGRYLFLVDGRALDAVSRRRTIELDTTGLSAGRHTLRAVAYRNGSVRTQIFARRTFVVANP